MSHQENIHFILKEANTYQLKELMISDILRPNLVSAVRDFLPTQAIYMGKQNEFCRNSTSQNHFQCRSRKITGPVPQNPWSFS